MKPVFLSNSCQVRCEKSLVDPILYTWKIDGELIILSVYLDDILIFGESEESIDMVIDMLIECFRKTFEIFFQEKNRQVPGIHGKG